MKFFIDGAYSYQVATIEKALCDKLYTLSPVKNVNEIKELLFENLRIDGDAFNNLNKENILKIVPLYHSKNLNLLVKFIGEEK